MAPSMATAAAVVAVVAVVLWQVDAPLLLTATSTTGGDTGAHFAMPALFGEHLFPHLTGWDPGWYDGFPAYTFYFVLPDVLSALGAHAVGYDVAFKLSTMAGSLLLPVAAWAMGRLFGLRRPAPAALAAATLPFLFDPTWTIDGGNLFSTLAGEYSYSLSLVFLLLFVGLFARGIRVRRHRGWASLALAVCVLSHVVPAAVAVVAAAVLVLCELFGGRLRLLGPGREPSVGAGARGRLGAVWWGASTVVLGGLLAGWWIVPFVLDRAYTTSMNYAKVTTYVAVLFPRADLWALVLAGIAVVVAVWTRSRFGVVVAAVGGVCALVVIFDPLSSLYNVRFLPLWFLCAYLLCGWVVALGLARMARAARGARVARWTRRVVAATVGAGATDPAGATGPGGSGPALGRPPGMARWAPGAFFGAVVVGAAALAVVVPPLVPEIAAKLPDVGVHPGTNQVSVWARWNYTGYEGKPAYAEYHALMALMGRIGKTRGCGRAMWEYNADENRFGTPEALMLLPYWTNGCVDSMEGLLFESSATTPYHFVNQAELSSSPSDAVVGLPYGPVTVHLGVEHLQLLGVRYLMVESPQVERGARADPTLRLVAKSGPWSSTYEGEDLTTTWWVYEVRHSQVVQGLREEPAVLEGVSPAQRSWLGRLEPDGTVALGPSMRWYLDPRAWHAELAASGPPAWPRTAASHATDPPAVRTQPAGVSKVTVGWDSVSFTVRRTHVPVLVKVSYFPNWQATGAQGPWRATPNLMVVVPTKHRVRLFYGTTTATRLGEGASALGVLALAGAVAAWLFRRARGARG